MSKIFKLTPAFSLLHGTSLPAAVATCMHTTTRSWLSRALGYVHFRHIEIALVHDFRFSLSLSIRMSPHHLCCDIADRGNHPFSIAMVSDNISVEGIH